MNHAAPGALRRRLIAAGSLAAAAALAFTGCASGGSGGTTEAAGDEPIGVSLIVKTTTNPFFVAMQEGAEAAADDLGVELTFAAGKEDGDEDTQIQAVENAISKGDAGILITPNGPAVEDALVKARDAGLFVIALDTPPSDPESVDITFATDNYLAGQKIGEWTAAKLAGEKATIAMIDLFDDKVVSVDVNRDQGFLDGMGIDLADETANGDEEATGTTAAASTRSSATRRRRAPRTAAAPPARRCCRRTPTSTSSTRSTSPAAYGAYEAFKAAGATDDLIVVSVDGGCAGIDAVKEGIIGATSQQYPVKMAELGVQAIFDLVQTGEVPEVTEGLEFFDTGVALVTDEPQDGVDSIDAAEGSEICWG